jgi:hypothetical protein
MQIFHFVKNTANTIGWPTTPGHSAFDKHELRQIKYLMGDFTAMLASAGPYLNF